jgi:hypothetical protein
MKKNFNRLPGFAPGLPIGKGKEASHLLRRVLKQYMLQLAKSPFFQLSARAYRLIGSQRYSEPSAQAISQFRPF